MGHLLLLIADGDFSSPILASRQFMYCTVMMLFIHFWSKASTHMCLCVYIVNACYDTIQVNSSLVVHKRKERSRFLTIVLSATKFKINLDHQYLLEQYHNICHGSHISKYTEYMLDFIFLYNFWCYYIDLILRNVVIDWLISEPHHQFIM